MELKVANLVEKLNFGLWRKGRFQTPLGTLLKIGAVAVLTFYSNDPRSNPSEAYSFLI